MHFFYLQSAFKEILWSDSESSQEDLTQMTKRKQKCHISTYEYLGAQNYLFLSFKLTAYTEFLIFKKSLKSRLEASTLFKVPSLFSN